MDPEQHRLVPFLIHSCEIIFLWVSPYEPKHVRFREPDTAAAIARDIRLPQQPSSDPAVDSRVAQPEHPAKVADVIPIQQAVGVFQLMGTHGDGPDCSLQAARNGSDRNRSETLFKVSIFRLGPRPAFRLMAYIPSVFICA